jgi:hypothetical protein
MLFSGGQKSSLKLSAKPIIKPMQGRSRCCLHHFFHVRNSFCLNRNFGARGNQRQAESQMKNDLIIRSYVTRMDIWGQSKNYLV